MTISNIKEPYVTTGAVGDWRFVAKPVSLASYYPYGKEFDIKNNIIHFSCIQEKRNPIMSIQELVDESKKHSLEDQEKLLIILKNNIDLNRRITQFSEEYNDKLKKIRSLKGSLKMNLKTDYKEILKEELHKTYL